MKKIIFLCLFFSTVLMGCSNKQLEKTVDSKVKIIESTDSISTEDVSDTHTIETTDDESNYTLQAIRKTFENAEISDFIIRDRPDDYKVLAEQYYSEGDYTFIIGPDNEEPAVYNENKEDKEQYILSNNPKATSVREVRLLLEELNQERIQSN